MAASGGGAGQFSGMGNIVANSVEAEINDSAVTAGGDVSLYASEDAPSLLSGLPLPNGMMDDVNAVLADAELDLSMNILALMVSVGGSGGLAVNAAMMGNVVTNKVRSRIIGSTVKADGTALGSTGAVSLDAMTESKIMALLVGGLTFFQQKLMGTAMADNPQAKVMLYVMPVMLTVFMLPLPSGLVLYILFNSILTIVQQMVINKRQVTL